MLKLDEILFYSEEKDLDTMIAEYFETVNYGQEISDPLFPRKINLSLKVKYPSLSFCDLLPTKIYGYHQSADSLTFYFLIPFGANVKTNIDRVIGSTDYVAELSAENTTIMNNTLYNWSKNKYQIYLRAHKEFDKGKYEQQYYLVTVTSIPLNDLFFFREME